MIITYFIIFNSWRLGLTHPRPSSSRPCHGLIRSCHGLVVNLSRPRPGPVPALSLMHNKKPGK